MNCRKFRTLTAVMVEPTDGPVEVLRIAAERSVLFPGVGCFMGKAQCISARVIPVKENGARVPGQWYVSAIFKEVDIPI